jgi:hypothetical protein
MRAWGLRQPELEPGPGTPVPGFRRAARFFFKGRIASCRKGQMSGGAFLKGLSPFGDSLFLALGT